MQPVANTQGDCQFCVTGCCSLPLPGALVTLSNGATCTTDGTGCCTITITDPGSYTYTITAPRFNSTSGGPVTLATQCGSVGTSNVNVTLTPSGSWVAGPGGFNDPYPTSQTLHLTDPVYGAVTLTFGPCGTGGVNAWCGSKSVTFAGNACCISTTVAMTYTLYQCGAVTGGYFVVTGTEVGPFGSAPYGPYCPSPSPPGGAQAWSVSGPCAASFVFTMIAGEPFDGTVKVTFAGNCCVGTSNAAQPGVNQHYMPGPVTFPITE
jgi:hypothetical protein